MSDEPLFKTDCPGCGAPVHARSATAVTLVCGYCNSMLVRQDGSIADTGRDSALMEDFGPLQIGTSGRFAAQGFTLIGRLQARYDAGVWNEWYALFDDGTAGWLSEAGDIYVMTRAAADFPVANAPEFDQIRAGFSSLTYQSKKFIASDVRNITLKKAAAQGELPFALPEEMPNRVADWRCENIFITLDYGGPVPEAFVGRTVKLGDLHLAGTRTDAQILEAAGRLKGEGLSENCPNCGSPVQWINGQTPHVVCPSCGSGLDTSGGKAELIEANNMREAQQQSLRLPLGAGGKINGKTYTVIGAVRKEELAAQDAFDALYGKRPGGLVPESSWTEYLLYNPQAGFLWIVETADGEWSLSETLTDWPRLDANGQPQGSSKLYDYGGQVSYAAGAFYWHIRRGDLNYYSDYRQGHGKISAEYSPNELAWSKSTGVGYAQIAGWFGLQDAGPARYSAGTEEDEASKGLVALMLAVFLIVNMPALFMAGGSPAVSLAALGLGSFVLFRRGSSGSNYLVTALVVICFFTFFHYLILSDDGAGSSSYVGTGAGAGGFSGGHK